MIPPNIFILHPNNETQFHFRVHLGSLASEMPHVIVWSVRVLKTRFQEQCSRVAPGHEHLWQNQIYCFP